MRFSVARKNERGTKMQTVLATNPFHRYINSIPPPERTDNTFPMRTVHDLFSTDFTQTII